MTYRVCVLAAIALVSSLTLAAAQSVKPNPRPPVGAWEGVATGGATARADISAHPGPALTITIGWNTVHATNCISTTSAKGVVTITVVPSEGGSFWTTIPQLQAMMIAQCALGNWISFYVTKKVGANYVWSQVESWTYK